MVFGSFVIEGNFPCKVHLRRSRWLYEWQVFLLRSLFYTSLLLWSHFGNALLFSATTTPTSSLHHSLLFLVPYHMPHWYSPSLDLRNFCHCSKFSTCPPVPCKFNNFQPPTPALQTSRVIFYHFIFSWLSILSNYPSNQMPCTSTPCTTTPCTTTPCTTTISFLPNLATHSLDSFQKTSSSCSLQGPYPT